MKRAPTLAFVAGMVVVAAGFFAGLGALDDNSFLTHLSTGRIIVDTHQVPSRDPYTFTAAGEPWVVQSWLASVAFGLADKWAGAGGVYAVVAPLTAALAALVWLLSRPARSLVARLLIAAFALGVGLDFWIERPLLFGLVALGLCLLAAEKRLDPRWLVPAMWVWVNAHGSFPLGLVALGALALGARLDGERRPAAELAALKWAGVGTVLGVLSPLGPKLLLFPAELLSRQSVLQHVVEWQAPGFKTLSQRVFLAEVLVAILVLVRRPSWRAGIPLALFTAAALLGARNVVVASIVIIPGLARGLEGLGSVTGEERRSVFRVGVAAVAALMVLGFVSRADETYSDAGYPVRALRFLEREDLTDEGTHLVSQDFVGNYLESRLGPRRIVFLDDRFDMFPEEVVDDYILLRGRPGWDDVLERYDPAAVLWERRQPLAELLRSADGWEVAYEDLYWVVFTPTG